LNGDWGKCWEEGIRGGRGKKRMDGLPAATREVIGLSGNFQKGR